MKVGRPYYVCYKSDGKMEYVTPNEYLTYNLDSALRFDTKEDAFETIRVSKENHEDNEFSFIASDFDVYAGCSVGEISTSLTKVNKEGV